MKLTAAGLAIVASLYLVAPPAAHADDHHRGFCNIEAVRYEEAINRIVDRNPWGRPKVDPSVLRAMDQLAQAGTALIAACADVLDYNVLQRLHAEQLAMTATNTLR
jgi:hypothetical protein